MEAILFNNPNEEVRARACFTLAILLKAEADYGQKKELTTEAIQRFEQVLEEFDGLGRLSLDLIHKSKGHLFDLRNTFVGHQALALEGVDFEGESVKLSDYRGHVVMIHFWSHTYNDASWHRQRLQRFQGKPFTIIAVNCDDERTNAISIIEQQNVTWPTIADGLRGPIGTAWNIHQWSSRFVLDREGIIRYREMRGKALEEAVGELLAE